MVIGGPLPHMHTQPGVPSTPGGPFITMGDGLSQPAGGCRRCHPAGETQQQTTSGVECQAVAPSRDEPGDDLVGPRLTEY
jgi:hypothetical protein